MLPRAPGSYLLFLRLHAPASIACRRLGILDFCPGWYVYVGSARGAGGLAGRIAYHVRPARIPHWHIDYLRAVCELIAVGYALGRQKRECRWADSLAALLGAHRPVPSFGASDCRCGGHLVYFAEKPAADAVASAVGEPLRFVSLKENKTGCRL